LSNTKKALEKEKENENERKRARRRRTGTATSWSVVRYVVHREVGESMDCGGREWKELGY
jgi:hypothetical protein